MSNETAKQCVIQTLEMPEILRIRVHIGSVSITGQLLRRVLTCVSQGRIGVQHVPQEGNGFAEYDHGTDSLYIGFDRITRMTQEAKLVHESVHAGLDLAGASQMRLTSSEAGAYIAQCIFAKLKSGRSDERLMSNDPVNDRVFEIAWTLAEGILAGRQPTGEELDSLRQAISRHSNYRGERRLAGYDGVRPLQRR